MLDVKQLLLLYPEYKKVYGPYLNKDGRKRIILYDGVKRSGMQYCRAIMSVFLGRRLEDNETVDHIDRDYSNDSIENLQILSRSEHARLDARRRRDIYAFCVGCNVKFKLSRSQVTARNRLSLGPFCSKRCSGKYGKRVQLKKGTPLNMDRPEISYYYEIKDRSK